MRLWEFDKDFADWLYETASSGATSAGNVASITGALWSGPTKGRYPYVEPDYEAAGLERASLRVGQTGALPKDKKKKRKKEKPKVTVLRR